MKNILYVLVLTIIILGRTQSAEATMIGDTISGEGAGLTPTQAMISGDEVEFTGLDGWMSFDFDEGTLTMTIAHIGWSAWGSVTFSGFDDVITDFTLDSNTIWGSNTDFLTDYSFTEDSITLNMDSGYSSPDGARAIFTITQGVGSAPVPEPATLSLLGIGIIGLLGGAARKKLKKKAVVKT